MRGEESEGENQRCAADHDVAIDRDHAQEIAAVEDAPEGKSEESPFEPAQDEKPDERAGGLGNQSAERRAAHAEHEPIDEPDVEADVEEIDEDLQRKGEIGAGPAGDRAEHDIIGEDEGRRPNSNIEIGARRLGDFLARTERRKAYVCDRRLQEDEPGAEHSGGRQRPQQSGLLLDHIALADRLGGEPGRAHAQKAEAPEDEIENDHGHGDGAEKLRGAEPADHGRIGKAEQRRRQIGEGKGQSQPQDMRMAHAHRVQARWHARVGFIGGQRGKLAKSVASPGLTRPIAARAH